MENQDWASGPAGRSGPRAGGPSGRWAAGLFLAKPACMISDLLLAIIQN